MEGFRVLPYGMPGDDWLKVDRDYVTRSREFNVSSLIDDAALPRTDKEGFFLIGNRGYFGAVLLTEDDAPGLDMVVNREGFVSNAAYDHLTEYVRAGLDLSVRARAALDRRLKDKKFADAVAQAAADAEAADVAARAAGHRQQSQADQADTDTPNRPDSNGRTPNWQSDQGYAQNDQAGNDHADDDGPEEDAETERLHELLRTARQATEALANDESGTQRASRAEQLRATLQVIEVRLEAVRDEQLALRTLAGVGTQYAAFIHEVNGLLGQAQALRELVNQLPLTTPFTGEQARLLRALRASAEELVQSLTRQTSYLTDVIGPDARRRRRRMPVTERVDSALRLLAPRMNERHQQLVLEIPDDLKTPPIFPAEMAIIMTNLLTNSIKFAGDGGKILITAALDDQSRLHVTVANTGVRVARRDFERYFEAFESSTQQVDVMLGQGMGMGLPIVRSLVSSYGGEAHFVKPPAGIATAVEVVLPDPRPRRTPRAA
jgi:signal transduction histidine kinase